MQTTTDRVQKQIEALSILQALDYQHRASPLAKIHEKAEKLGYKRRRGSWTASLATLAAMGAVSTSEKVTRVDVGTASIPVTTPCWRITAAGRRRLQSLLDVDEQP